MREGANGLLELSLGSSGYDKILFAKTDSPPGNQETKRASGFLVTFRINSTREKTGQVFIDDQLIGQIQTETDSPFEFQASLTGGRHRLKFVGNFDRTAPQPDRFLGEVLVRDSTGERFQEMGDFQVRGNATFEISDPGKSLVISERQY